ncbi:putative alpha/beta hydrolase [Tanacetum coccineum]
MTMSHHCSTTSLTAPLTTKTVHSSVQNLVAGDPLISSSELRARPCPLILASFSGGSQACTYKVFQIIEGTCEAHLSLDDSRLIMTCISGQMYDSGPVNVTGDLGARFALHSSNVPGSSKLLSMVAKGVTSGLDALFLTRFGSQRSEYWETLYSSVGLGAPFLILCSERDDLASYPVVYTFAQQVQGLGGHVRLFGWKNSPHVGHYKHYPTEYKAAVNEFFDHSVSIFNQKLQQLAERTGMEGMHDKICELVCDLQNAAVDSNQSLRRVAVGPNDHFFLPSSAEYQSSKESGSLQDEQKERRAVLLASPPSLNPHSVLGQVLFDVCVPKNIEERDDLAPYPVVYTFAQQVQGLGGHVRLFGWKDSPHVGHYKHYFTEYRAAVIEFFDHSVSIFNQKLQQLAERTGMEVSVAFAY